MGRLILSEFMTIDGVMEAPAVSLRGVPGQWELFEASIAYQAQPT